MLCRAPRAARPSPLGQRTSCPTKSKTNGTPHPLPHVAPSTVRLQVSTRINATNHRLREYSGQYSGAVCSWQHPLSQKFGALDTLSLR